MFANKFISKAQRLIWAPCTISQHFPNSFANKHAGPARFLNCVLNNAACSKKPLQPTVTLSWSWNFTSFNFTDCSVVSFSEDESFAFTGACYIPTCLLDGQDKTKIMNLKLVASIKNAFGGDFKPRMLHKADFFQKTYASST